jgi:hypothetical protein
MYLVVREARGNSAEAELLLAERFPTEEHTIVILNTSSELAQLCLFAYFLIKNMFSLSFTLYNTCVLKSSEASTTKRRRYTGRPVLLENRVAMLWQNLK